MKLLAFRIRSFRSIIDTGWNSLSSDNITGIIGQNESGKTSILEALLSFYTGEISDDIIRSDLKMPRVSCRFKSQSRYIREQLDDEQMPKGLIKLLTSARGLTLTRVWHEDKSSQVIIDGDEIAEFFDRLDGLEEKRDQGLKKTMEVVLSQTQRTKEELNQLLAEKQLLITDLEVVHQTISDSEKMLRKGVKEDHRERLEKTIQMGRESYQKIDSRVKLKDEEIQKKSVELDRLIPKAEVSVAIQDIERKVELTEQKKRELNLEIMELENIIEYSEIEKEVRSAQLKLDITRDLDMKSSAELQERIRILEIKKNIAARIFKNEDVKSAERLVEKEFENLKPLYSRVELGKELFRLAPEFVLFEDFSSLLPDRIDLDDIMNDNYRVEGFKAAQNFLVISGLTPNFFQQENNRILKQKIENLNNEISVNFQEYWRQHIGKKSKIKINFELEHYDSLNMEKAGRPFLEFWIRDEFERLYPKQRSRGVRWFLSFYLELKANALSKERGNRVLLIDEPAMSLHARAQEDVLKVFEDIKGQVQVVYTTHSPHLIDLNRLYRLLAVQRTDIEDERSETMVFDSKSLQEASSDTLSPIYTLMGARITDQKYIQPKNNIILEDISTYYYFTTLFKIWKIDKKVFFLPSTDVAKVEILVNLLTGWGFEFLVILDDDEDGRSVYLEMKRNLFDNNDDKARMKILKMDGFDGIEDLFSTLDFKKYILQKRVGIPESNSEYISNNNLSKSILATSFQRIVQEEKLTISDFDDETRENIGGLLKSLIDMII